MTSLKMTRYPGCQVKQQDVKQSVLDSDFSEICHLLEDKSKTKLKVSKFSSLANLCIPRR